MNNLSLQIAQIHLIAIDDSYRSNSGRSQVQTRRRTETTRSNDQYLRREQFLLTGTADLFEDYMPTVPFYLLFS
jgi:hypothetical protein